MDSKAPLARVPHLAEHEVGEGVVLDEVLCTTRTRAAGVQVGGEA